jgi:hypothetical protein
MFIHVYNDHEIFLQNDQQCAMHLELTDKGINKQIDKGADLLNSL